MTNRWRTYTTEKLFLADIQLKAWQRCQTDSPNDFKPLEESHKQAFILLLAAAWEGFLNELAEYHQQTSGSISSLEQLLSAVGSEIPEVEYLVELNKVNGSWISDLLQANSLTRMPANREAANSTFNLADNALIATSETKQPVDSFESLSRIWEEFKGYLDGVRSRMSEW
ncbi:DUF6586 family protein [Alkalimarinus sediminis]|uniref:Uncharacterized protein n=1 Tax=Alkalimarinus sediminis TaxID=1632866 RepID=A0A9E8KRP3_9ALTE|nr:DUF6586 family protein [Alkalimarinus sediminis]UZW76625.1 hypothetical protein NNL22_08595 [Alkalimarinus sediminis]